MSRLKTWSLHPHGSRELEGIGVESRPELILMHLTNSRPTLSLCMTGRGESRGNEEEKREVESVVR